MSLVITDCRCLLSFNLFAGGEHSDGYRQIKASSILFHVGGREIDSGAANGKFEAGIGERRRDAVA